jgi:hypothetical protein
MVSVVLSHVIGTVGLLTILLSSGTYYTMFYTSLQDRIALSQLDDVASVVALDFTELISLIQLSEHDNLLVLDLKIPPEIHAAIYNVTLLRVASGDETHLAVHVMLDPSNYAQRTLPWAASDQLRLYDGAPLTLEGVTPLRSVYSPTGNAVLWCERRGTVVTIGLGVRG